MENFTFYNRTKILFGKKRELEIGKELKKIKIKKVLIHYGSNRIKKELLPKIIKLIKKENIKVFELGGVVPNPRLSKVKEGIIIAKKKNIDFILAIGGGSVIDSAKAIAMGVFYKGDVWDFYENKIDLKKTLPIGTILTIPAAGSESSPATVITNEKIKRKKAFKNPKLQPIFSILNPELSLTLPKYQTSCGISDMLAHTMERYFVSAKSTSTTDKLCLAHIKSIIHNGKLLIKKTEDYNLRAEIMLAGYIAHNGWLNVGRSNGDWASHAIEHELSAEYDIAHGAGLSIIFPAWMKYVFKENKNKFYEFGKEIFNIKEKNEKGILKTIKKLEKFYKEIDMPIRLSQLNIKNPNIKKMAEHATNKKTIGNFKILNKKDVEKIYELSL